MARNLKITVDHDMCVGNAECVRTAGATFFTRHDGLADVVDPYGDEEEAIVDAGVRCPSGAINVIDIDTGEDLLK